MEQINTTSKRAAIGKAVVFLALEILAIVGFGLGNSFIFYSVLSVVILGLTIFAAYKQINKEGISSYLFFLFPILLYGILAAFSYFNKDQAFDLYGGLSCFVPIGLVCFSATGYFLSINKEFKIKTALLVIYSAVALFTVINLFATCIHFAPFHTLIYKNKYIYFDGAPSSAPVGEMAYMLMGFQMSETSIAAFSLYPSVLLSAFVPLFFMKFKEDKKSFLLYLGFGLLGLICLVCNPTKMLVLSDLLVVVVLAIVVLVLKGIIKKDVLAIVSVVIGVLFLGCFLILTMCAQSQPNGLESKLQNVIGGNSFLNRLFVTNRVVSPFRSILDRLFSTYKAFGVPTWSTTSDYLYPQGTPLSGSWFFDNIVTTGSFGAIFFILVLVFGIRRLYFYFKYSEDELKEKAVIFGFIFSFLAYTVINYDSTPFIFADDIFPVYESGLFMIMLCLFSYCFARSDKPKAPVTEEVKEEIKEEEVAINEEEVSL